MFRARKSKKTTKDLFIYEFVNTDTSWFIEDPDKRKHATWSMFKSHEAKGWSPTCFLQDLWFDGPQKTFGCSRCVEHPFCVLHKMRYSEAAIQNTLRSSKAAMTENQHMAASFHGIRAKRAVKEDLGNASVDKRPGKNLFRARRKVLKLRPA